MPSSRLSLTLIYATIHANKLLITAQPIRNLRTPASAEMNKKGFSRHPLPSLPSPPGVFPSSISPTHFDACYSGYLSRDPSETVARWCDGEETLPTGTPSTWAKCNDKGHAATCRHVFEASLSLMNWGEKSPCVPFDSNTRGHIGNKRWGKSRSCNAFIQRESRVQALSSSLKVEGWGGTPLLRALLDGALTQLNICFFIRCLDVMVLPSTPICSICLGALVRTAFVTHCCHLLFHNTCLYRSLRVSQTIAPSCSHCHRLFGLVHFRQVGFWVWQESELEGGKWSQLVVSPPRPCPRPQLILPIGFTYRSACFGIWTLVWINGEPDTCQHPLGRLVKPDAWITCLMSSQWVCLVVGWTVFWDSLEHWRFIHWFFHFWLTCVDCCSGVSGLERWRHSTFPCSRRSNIHWLATRFIGQVLPWNDVLHLPEPMTSMSYPLLPMYHCAARAIFSCSRRPLDVLWEWYCLSIVVSRDCLPLRCLLRELFFSFCSEFTARRPVLSPSTTTDISD